MARTKNQAARREQFVAATIAIIAEQGLAQLRSVAVAERVGVSARLIAYYYPDIESLVEEAHASAVDRYYWSRRRRLEDDDEPIARLATLIGSGLPGVQDTALSQMLNELSVNAARSPAHAALTRLLFERETSLYVCVLEDGVSQGAFRPRLAVSDIARNLVALEDAYGFHLLAQDSAFHFADALQALASYASTALEVDLAVSA